MKEQVTPDPRLVVSLLLLVQLLSVFFLWALNSVSPVGGRFLAIFLAVDLVSFAIISYAYRVERRGDQVSGKLMLAGCFLALFLMISVLFIR
jgi:hypothetical protein